MTNQRNRRFSLTTRIAQALHFVEEDTGAVIPAIQPSATYARDENYRSASRTGIAEMGRRRRLMLRQ